MPHARAIALAHALAAASLAWPAAGEPEEACVPAWYREQRDYIRLHGGSLDNITCPHGVRLPMDVTWRHSGELQFPEMLLCVFYSYVPAAVIAVAVIEFLWVRGTRELFFVLFVAVTVAINELVVKRLVREPRPEESCCITCGMPSSHSSFATGFFLLMFLDSAYRVNPMDMGRARTRWAILRDHTIFLRGGGPLSNPRTLSNRAFVYQCFQWGGLLLPVPLSRIYLKDHSVNQVIVGSFAGVVYALSSFYGAYEPFTKYAESWSKHGHLLVNTLKLPWWRQTVLASSTHTDPEDWDLIYGRTLTQVEVPISSVEVRDGQSFGVLRGRRLEVFGGKWAGVAWPTAHAGGAGGAAGGALDSEATSDSTESSALSICRHQVVP